MSDYNLSDIQLEVLMRAVRLARDFQIQEVATLKSRLLTCGYSQEDIDIAIKAWANKEREAMLNSLR